MNALVENLVMLQTLEKDGANRAGARSKSANELRSQIPSTVLATYDRLVKRKRTAIAVVRHGVCSGCHLQIPVGVMGSLARTGVQPCSNCGRLVYLAEDPAAQGRDPKAKAEV